MGFLKAAPPAPAKVDDEPAEDMDFMEEDLEEEVEEKPDTHEYDGPRAWEEVEDTESQRVSLNIATHAVPSNDSGEAAARLAWQAAVLESENQDPLGLGRIDAHGLRLVSVLLLFWQQQHSLSCHEATHSMVADPARANNGKRRGCQTQCK